MANRKKNPIEFSQPSERVTPIPEWCPSCKELCEPSLEDKVGGAGYWRCDLCGYRFLASFFYWQWVATQT